MNLTNVGTSVGMDMVSKIYDGRDDIYSVAVLQVKEASQTVLLFVGNPPEQRVLGILVEFEIPYISLRLDTAYSEHDRTLALETVFSFVLTRADNLLVVTPNTPYFVELLNKVTDKMYPNQIDQVKA